jgi:hypothetical protein
MNESQLIDDLMPVVKHHVEFYFAQRPVTERASLTSIQEVAQESAKAINACVFEVWKKQLVKLAEAVGTSCPDCGKKRRHRWRHSQPMKLDVLGMVFELPRLYLECNHCTAPGVSIIKVLTGLKSGDASEQQKLMAAYSAADHSYREASRDLEAHYGRPVERTKVRRMALEVEQSAMTFAEQSREEALERLRQEGRIEGPCVLMLEGDGGKVRTGRLEECEPDDAGFGKTTAKWGIPRKKRPTNFREVITFDVREPGEVEPSALDVMVPVQCEKGERTRRMLALAARKGMGENTRVIGLGDMGSGLASAFDEAFDVNPASFWQADWKHTRDYVRDASKVILDLDVKSWGRAMRQAIWDRDVKQRDELLEQARQHRKAELPADVEKCPVETLATYLTNNWNHMRVAELHEHGLPIVSARAEAQVRDRTKRRFSGPGVWRIENLEPKGTLRSVIAEGRWGAFCSYHLDNFRERFHQQLIERLNQAIEEGCLCPDHVSNALDLHATAAIRSRSPSAEPEVLAA